MSAFRAGTWKGLAASGIDSESSEEEEEAVVVGEGRESLDLDVLRRCLSSRLGGKGEPGDQDSACRFLFRTEIGDGHLDT